MLQSIEFAKRPKLAEQDGTGKLSIIAGNSLAT
jgi:hypothetical protein